MSRAASQAALRAPAAAAVVDEERDPSYGAPSHVEPAAGMGKYRAFLELGQGGTAVVFLGVSRGLGGFNKLVVLKMLKRGLANQTDFRRMFLSEARLSARLNHPNIVQVYEVTERNNAPIIVMEYLEGKPLSDVRAEREGAVPLELQLRILADGLHGLHYSHELKDFDGTPLDVVHRDFTPHNLFVTYDGQVKVLDFGIAKLSGSLVETETGVIKGKLRYMPPEQILGNRVDRRADVFAAGVILWEAITGKRMWNNLSEATILNRVSRGEIPTPESANPQVSPELAAICMRALAPNVDERYATAAEFRAALEDWLRSSGHTVSTSEVGEYMSRTFDEFRQATRQVVERHLSAARLSSVQEETDPHAVQIPAGELEPLHPSQAPETSVSASRTHTNSATSQTQQTSQHRGALLVAVGLALFAAAAYLAWGQSREPSTTPAASRTTPTAQPAVIEVSVTVAPASARILLDGKQLPSNPFTGRFPRDASEHTLLFEAPGHAPQSMALRLDVDRSVAVSLVPLPLEAASVPAASSEAVKSRKHGGVVPSKPATVVSSRPANGTRANCVVPYTLDENGFKVFKPGCL